MQTENKESTEALTEAKKNWIDPIEKDDLVEIAIIVNYLRYISGDMLVDFFYQYNPDKCKDDEKYCIFYHNRYRALAEIITSGIKQIDDFLIQHNITI